MKFLLYRPVGAATWTALADPAEWPTATGLAAGEHEAAAVEVAPITVTVTASVSPPAAFAPADWSLADAPSPAGDTLEITVSALPDDGGSAITDLQYRVGGGAAQSLGAVAAGTYAITVLAGVEASVEIRAVNAEGPGPWSDAKAAIPTASPEPFPADSVALWLVLGQSNAQGRAPRRQDPAKANVGAAVDFFKGLPLPAADYAGPHSWWGVSRPAITANPTVNGRLEPLSLAGGAPTTTTHVYTAGNFGIPVGTEGFGPEIGLVRAVLEGDVLASWRDDADPRLFVLKPANGSTGVDRFRDGGDLNAYLMEHLAQAGGENLASLAASKTVLLQGAIFVIGEQDSNDENDGSVEPGSFARRMAEWIRQVRGLFGHADLPVVLAEIFDDAGAIAKGAAINTQLAAVASAVGNATVLDSAGWGVADTVHYDAAAMDDLGARAFGWLRSRPEAREDGLIVTRPYAGTLRPVLLLPPVWKDHTSSSSVFYARASVDGALHLATLASPPADAAAVKVAAHVSEPVSPGTDHELTGAGFSSDVSTVWATVETAGGVFSEPVAVPRNPNPGKFVIDTPDLLVGGPGGISGSLRINTGGTIFWAVHPRARRTMTARDVIERACSPVAAGSEPILAPNEAQPFAVSGLAPGDYALLVTSVSGGGDEGETWRVDFVVP
ncbi:MAG: sialate O-acetylesterase [Paracoccaceae bacterium]